DLALEPSLGCRAQCTLVRLDRELLHVVAAEVPFLGDHLGRTELADFLRAVPAHPAFTAAERIVEPELLARGHGRRDRDERHLLHATGDDDVTPTREHRLRGEVHRLLRGTALTIDGRARHVIRKPGREPAGARDVVGLAADRVDATEHDTLDRA